MSEKKTLSVHARMANIKKELAETKINKSGHNKFAGFKYHELSDFIQHINTLNLKHGVNDLVEINEGEKYCKITLVSIDNSEDAYSIVTPYREAEMLGKGGAKSNVDAVQRMGSTITYNRRYLYMTAYNIQENDGVDSQEQPKPTPQAPKKKAKAKFKDFNKALQSVMNGTTTKAKIEANYEVSEEQAKLLTEAEITFKNNQ